MQTATVSIDEGFAVGSPPEVAWRLLTDPAVVVRCMPGASIVEERPDGTILGALSIKLGPTVVSFNGEVKPQFDESERQGSLVAEGADGQGRTRARSTTSFQVRPAEPTGATVAIRGEIEVAGPLAPFARTGGAHLARRMVAEFSANLAAHIDANAAAAVAPAGDAVDAGSMPARGRAAAPAVTPPPSAPLGGLRLLAGTILDIARSGVKRLAGAIRRLATNVAARRRGHS